DRHHAAAEEHVVQVRDHVVGLVKLGVHRYRAQVDAGDAADQEGGHEAEGEFHGQLEVDGTGPGGGDPVEELDAGGDRDQHRHDHEVGLDVNIHPHREHVVRPHRDGEEQ